MDSNRSGQPVTPSAQNSVGEQPAKHQRRQKNQKKQNSTSHDGQH